MRGIGWAFLLPLGAVAIQGINTAVSKMSAGVISPEAISLYRWIVAVGCVTPFLVRGFLREWPRVRQHIGRVILLGVLGMVIYQVLVYVAVQTTSATNVAIIGGLTPLMTIACSALILRDRPGWVVIAGCALSLFGVLILIERGDPTAIFSHRIVIGDLYVLVGLAFYALYSTLLRHWRLPISAPSLFYGQILVALILMVPGPLLGKATPLTWYNSALVLFAGLGGSVGAPFLWMLAVQRVGPVPTAIFTNLTPLITIAIAVLFLGEELHIYHAVGGLLTLAGVLLAQSAALRGAMGRSAPNASPVKKSL